MANKNHTVEAMLLASIKAAGADGLCNPRIECGCGVDDLAPCEGPGLDCVLARATVVDGDEAFMPMDQPKDCA